MVLQQRLKLVSMFTGQVAVGAMLKTHKLAITTQMHLANEAGYVTGLRKCLGQCFIARLEIRPIFPSTTLPGPQAGQHSNP